MVMRETAKSMIAYYTRELQLSGKVLEIGGNNLDQCAIEHWPAPRFEFTSLDLKKSDIPNVVVADITDAHDAIPDESFDIVWSSDVFEHIDRPWLAAAEITRILRPGGIAFTHTLWSWRNHPCPIDYWRYSPECLEFLFDGLHTIEKGYDLSARRNNNMGFWKSGADSVPLDRFGGFRENWAVFHVGVKGDVPQVVPFRESDAPQAHFMRMETQGTVTNPRMLGKDVPRDPLDTMARLDRIEQRLENLTSAMAGAQRSADVRHKALDSRIIGMGQPLPVRAYRKLRRRPG